MVNHHTRISVDIYFQNVAVCCPYLLSISKIDSVDIDHYGLDARNPVFVIGDQVSSNQLLSYRDQLDY